MIKILDFVLKKIKKILENSGLLKFIKFLQINKNGLKSWKTLEGTQNLKQNLENFKIIGKCRKSQEILDNFGKSREKIKEIVEILECPRNIKNVQKI